MSTRHKIRIAYVCGDYVATLVATLLFSLVRYIYDASNHGFRSFWDFISFPAVSTEIILFPLIMFGVYWLSGYYTEVALRSRIQEFITTLGNSLTGTLLFFFIAMVNDLDPERIHTYRLMLMLIGILWICLYSIRCTITAWVRRRILDGRISRPTLIVGCGDDAIDMAGRLLKGRRFMGMSIMGFVSPDAVHPIKISDKPVYTLAEAERLCDNEMIECLVVMPLQESADTIGLINKLLPMGRTVLVPSDFYQTLNAPVRTANVGGEPLVDVSHPNVSPSTTNIKRTLDVTVSLIALMIIWPVMLVIAVIIRSDSPGGAIYKQQRVGKNKKTFNIYKFRSMRVDAESDGQPRLSSPCDNRITRPGHWLRKYRLDELPQFWNVLRGDMSLVGPRPEREYFIDRIVRIAPAYTIVQQVKPGLTSWGMVKFGYASSVEEMVERLRYELIYIDNISILIDFKIILYTIKIVFTGKGI